VQINPAVRGTMAKCPLCNGCYKLIWYENKSYYYCGLCKTVYSREPGGILTKVEDRIIIKGVLTLAGTAI
jgi:hypothetical protein